MNIIQTLKESELLQVDLSVLLGVNRLTLNKWYKGRKPHKLMEPKLTKLVAAIQRSIDAGDLPLKQAFGDKEERQNYIAGVIYKHLKP